MVERNQQCPCGSGLKYKKCCWLKDQRRAPSIRYDAGAPPPEVLAAFERHRLERERQKRQYGEVKDVISTEFQDHRIVAVGNTLHWSKTWKTFPDFLFDYIKTTLGVKAKEVVH